MSTPSAPLNEKNGVDEPFLRHPDTERATPISEPDTYAAPKTGFVSYLPGAIIPYAQLMRLDRSGGFYAFYVPYVLGSAYAGCLSISAAQHPSGALAHGPLPPLTILSRLLFFVPFCVVLRGAACTWNDNIDQDFDRQVARTRLRPIARGAVSTAQGHAFAAVQTLLCAGLAALALPLICLLDLVPIIVLFGIYPFGKRFTNFPQLILGFPFAGAIVLAAHAVGVEPLADGRWIPTLSLIIANVMWTMVYDTIYAHQDLKHDLQAGVKSMAVKFQNTTKLLSSCLTAAIIVLLVLAGWWCQWGLAYFVLSVGGTAGSLTAMITLVDLEVPASCAWWFKYGFWFVGGALVGGFGAEYVGYLQ